jgi:hypothetical protein
MNPSIVGEATARFFAQVGENGRVHFISACKQVMRFVCLGDDLVFPDTLWDGFPGRWGAQVAVGWANS